MTISWCQYMYVWFFMSAQIIYYFYSSSILRRHSKVLFLCEKENILTWYREFPYQVEKRVPRMQLKNKMNSLCRISLYVIFWFCLLTVLKPPFLIKLCPCLPCTVLSFNSCLSNCFLNLVFGLTCISICLFACLSNCFLNLSFLYSPLQVQIQLRSHGISLPYLLQWKMFRE